MDAAKDPREALKWNREALNFLSEYNIAQGYGYRFALEPKPNEPRGDIYLPTTGNMLAFIETLDHPEMVGVNPEVAHETIAGLNFYHAVAQAIDMGKLFHVDLNSQKPGRLRVPESPRPYKRSFARSTGNVKPSTATVPRGVVRMAGAYASAALAPAPTT